MLATAEYGDYRAWLEENFFFELCSYCLIRNLDLEIDHYEPRGYRPDRVHDPHNLLLACGSCNGPGGKKDYHPSHDRRSVYKHDVHMILDVRNDDFAKLFTLSKEGELITKGPERERANWNVSVLNWDLKKRRSVRSENLRTLAAADGLVDLIERDVFEESKAAEIETTVLAPLVEQLARNRLFFDVFDVVMSPALRVRVDAERSRQLAENAK